MTLDELLDLVRARGWGPRLHVQGVSTGGLADNVYVIGQDADGWFVGFHERGVTEVMSRHPDEGTTTGAVLKLLQDDHKRTDAAPAAPAARMATRGAEPKKGWSTWTFGKRG